MTRFCLALAQKRIIDTGKVYMSDIMASLSQYGFPVEITDNNRFSSILQAKSKDEQAVKYLTGILACQRGSDVLLRLGFRWPLITETCYFDLTAAGT